MRFLKRFGLCFLALLLLVSVCIASSLFIMHLKTIAINDDISALYGDEKYSEAFSIDSISVFEQSVSCGYAVIEMIGQWNKKEISEESLYDTYGKVVTSTGKAFMKEMNKQFIDYTTTMYPYLKNTELIEKVYQSLANGIPVPFEWAAEYNGEWTLHYSLIIGIDVVNDSITVANPYGYYENITLKEFLNRTSFEAYTNMPIYLKLGFAFGLFEKNTIFIMEEIN